jgi:hypothetical protein
MRLEQIDAIPRPEFRFNGGYPVSPRAQIRSEGLQHLLLHVYRLDHPCERQISESLADSVGSIIEAGADGSPPTSSTRGSLMTGGGAQCGGAS